MDYKDYYRILEVDKNASQQEVKRAYRRLARRYHPDRNPNDRQAEERFKALNQAYEVLGTPEQRADYDHLCRGHQRFRQSQATQGGFNPGRWASGQRVNVDPGDGFGSRGAGGFSDLFNAIFGASGRDQSAPDSQAAATGKDTEIPVEITLEEAYAGASRPLSRNGRAFTAKIPPGADSGTRVRLRGKGGRGPGGPGDLYLRITVLPHGVFCRDGNDLRVTVAIDAPTAVLGGAVSVPTLAGPVSLTIPAGTQGGAVFRLRGKGMPDPQRSKSFGDLLATINLRVPESPSDRERQLYQELDRLGRADHQ